MGRMREADRRLVEGASRNRGAATIKNNAARYMIDALVMPHSARNGMMRCKLQYRN
jgi:hypothetical protein